MPDVKVKILFFAKARELVNVEESSLTLPSPITYEELKKKIFRELFPVLQDIENCCVLAVDQRYAEEGEEIQLLASSEIAIIPPLSGG